MTILWSDSPKEQHGMQILYTMDTRPGDCKGAVELTFRITFQVSNHVDATNDYEPIMIEIPVDYPKPIGRRWLNVTENAELQELLSVQYEQGNLFDKFDEAWQAGQVAAREDA